MTPQEALALLDNLCSQVSLTRQQHEQVAEAVATLSPLVNPESFQPLPDE